MGRLSFRMAFGQAISQKRIQEKARRTPLTGLVFRVFVWTKGRDTVSGDIENDVPKILLFAEKMPIERITLINRDTWIDDIADLGNAFLASIGVCSTRDSRGDKSVIDSMIAAEQTEIFLAIADCGRAVGVSYFNVGTGFSCGGNYIWVNGVYVIPEHRQEGHGSALLGAIEAFGKALDSQLVISTRDSDNHESDRMFSRGNYLQNEQVVITKSTPG